MNLLNKIGVRVLLKTCELTHQDIGQMDMYVRMYDEQRRGSNEHIFASKYKLVLPSEAKLRAELDREQRILLKP